MCNFKATRDDIRSHYSTFKPVGAKVLSLVLQNASLLLGSGGSVLSIEIILTSLIKPL